MQTLQKGFIHIFLLLFVIAVILVGVLYFFSRSPQLSKYVPENLRIFNKEAALAPTTQYQNPLDTKSQYTNPFSTYKNPFDNLTAK